MDYAQPGGPLLADIKGWVEQYVHYGANQRHLLQYWMDQLSPLNGALMVSLDLEWWEHDRSKVTEIGVSILDPTRITDGSSPWTILKAMVTHHARIKKNAHLVNSDLCPGKPDMFQFGTTSFVGMQDAGKMLQSCFQNFDSDGMLRPVIFVRHAVDNDVKVIKEHFGLDIDALGVVVATLDTQVLASEYEMTSGPGKPKLKDLLAIYSIDEWHLHIAGNDAACTMAVTMFMPSPDYFQVTATSEYATLKPNARWATAPRYGTENFCLRCSADGHTTSMCQVPAYCNHCSASGDMQRANRAATHWTEKCLVAIKAATRAAKNSTNPWKAPPRLPVPCPLCVISLDPTRNDPDFAYGHKQQDCSYESWR